jgi:ABC-type lipoprotein export system ATPase subunit
VYPTKKGPVHALDHVNFKFKPGEMVAILGYSGSGKTTLVSLLGGLEKPSSGSMYHNEKNVTSFSESDWVHYRKNHVGFVFQKFHLIKHLTAIENIKLAMSLSGLGEKEKELKALALLKDVDMLEQKDQYPTELSGGQRQRVAIARALSNSPDMILADEPTGSLDPKTGKQIMNVLKDLSKKGHLVVVVTHNEKLAEDYATRIVRISDGRIDSDVMDGPVNSIEKTYRESQTHFPIKSAVKLAYNNLKVRKVSSLLSIFSLIPAFILMFLLSSLVFNLNAYKEELSPVLDDILPVENVYYLSPMDNDDYVNKVGYFIRRADEKDVEEGLVNKYESMIYQPFSDKDISEIKSLSHVKEVVKPAYLTVSIKGREFLLIPSDVSGVSIKSPAAKALLGKYAKDVSVIKGQKFSFEVLAYNGLPIHQKVIDEGRHTLDITFEHVDTSEYLTKQMNLYYGGYIYVTQAYFESILSNFQSEDFTFIDYKKRTYKKLGSQNIYDLLMPLRQENILNSQLGMFNIRKYLQEVPSGALGLQHKIVLDGYDNDKALLSLSQFGVYSDSKYDKKTVSEARRTKSTIERIFLMSCLLIVSVLLVPNILVLLVLFVSIISRVKEIGILRALGAKKIDIIKIFSLESMILGISSGLISLILFVPLQNQLIVWIESKFRLSYLLGSNPLHVNPMIVVLTYITAVLVMAILGIIPGLKASGQEPNVLLRKVK